jgi:hypothetical protein
MRFNRNLIAFSKNNNNLRETSFVSFAFWLIMPLLNAKINLIAVFLLPTLPTVLLSFK